jgi:hypothetical protein
MGNIYNSADVIQSLQLYSAKANFLYISCSFDVRIFNNRGHLHDAMIAVSIVRSLICVLQYFGRSFPLRGAVASTTTKVRNRSGVSLFGNERCNNRTEDIRRNWSRDKYKSRQIYIVHISEPSVKS